MHVSERPARATIGAREIADLDRHDIYGKSPSNTMVVFVHDFGNLRIEAEYHDTVEPNLASSYLVRWLPSHLASYR